jgi:abortive infection bacteriophage resistance protein
MVAAGQVPPFSPLKLHLSYREQVDLLRSRNLAIGDEGAALAALQSIGYYRLVGYWFPLRRPDPHDAKARLDDFQDDATFELAVDLYRIWVATETWDFGLLSKFYAGMKYGDQSKIAKRYGINAQTLESWLRALNFIRNVSAHHSRLWNRNNPEGLKLPPTQPHHPLHHLVGDDFARRRVYGSLCVMRHMLKSIDPASQWSDLLKKLCIRFPASTLVALRNGGFPNGWENQPLWRPLGTC